MSFFDLFDMTVAYVQYLYFLISISPESFTDFYAEPFRSLSFITLDFFDSISESNRYSNPLEITLPTWIPLDARLRFALIGVIAPLLVSIVGVLIVCPTLAFVWLLVTLAAFFSMIFGAILLADRWVFTIDGIPLTTRVLLVSIGSVFTVLLIAVGVFTLYGWNKERRKREDVFLSSFSGEIEAREKNISLAEKAVTRSATNRRALAALAAVEKEKESYLRHRRFAIIIPHVILTLAALFTGLLLTGVIPVKTIRFLQVSLFGRIPGAILIVGVFFALVWITLSMFKSGRAWQLKMYAFFSGAVLHTVLIIISLIYSPVLLSCISILWCTRLGCDVGERMSIPGSLGFRSPKSSLLGPPVVPCETCNFSTHTQNCPSSLQTSLCGEPVSEMRLAYDQTVPCAYIDVYYKLTVGVIFLAYTVSYPILLVLAADRGTKILENEYPLEKRLCDEFTEKELYYEKVQKSDNIAASIYQVYKRRYRKARLTFLLQRVLLVTITSLTRRGPGTTNLSWLGMILFLVVSVLYLSYTVVLRPYARPVENAFSASTQLMIAAVAVIGLTSASQNKNVVPLAVAVLVAVFVFVAPIMALLAGFIYTFSEARERAERLQRRLLSGFVVVKKEDQNIDLAAITTREIEEEQATAAHNNNNNNNNNNNKEPTNAEKKDGQEEGGDSEAREMERYIPVVGSTAAMHTSYTSYSVQSLQERNKQQKQKRAEERQKLQNSGRSTHMDIVSNPLLDGNDRRQLELAPSEPTTEREPLDMCAHVDGREDTMLLSSPSYPIPQQHTKDETLDFDKSEDDYFNDKRFFTPSGYFYEYNDVPVVLGKENIDHSQNEGEQQRTNESGEEEKNFSDMGFRNFFSMVASVAALGRFKSERGSHVDNTPMEDMSITEPKESSQNCKESKTAKEEKEEPRQQQQKEQQQKQQQEQQQEQKEEEINSVYNETFVARNDDVEGNGIVKWLRRWQEALMGTTLLRYEDVLERREKLCMSGYNEEKPFWLEPSETQLQAYNVPGCAIPWFCAKNNKCRVSELSPHGGPTVFSQIKERKNEKYSTLVAPRRFGQAAVTDSTPLTLVVPSTRGIRFNSLNAVGEDTSPNPSDDNSRVISQALLIRRASTDDSSDIHVSNIGTPGSNGISPAAISLVGGDERNSAKDDAKKKKRKQEQPKKKKKQSQSQEQQGKHQEGEEPNNQEEFGMLAWNSLASPRETTTFEVTRQKCLVDAEKKMQKIYGFTHRKIEQPCRERRRSTVFPPVIPQVRMEGVDAKDWDSFLNQLLEEVSDPLVRDTERHERTTSEKEVPPLTENSPGTSKPQERIKEERGDNGVEGHIQGSVFSPNVKATTTGLAFPQLSSAPPTPSTSGAPPPPPAEHMAELRRHFLLRQRLLLAFRGQRERLRALQEAVDNRIAMTIKKYLQVFFIGLGFAGALALVLCLCGMLRNSDDTFVDGVHPDTRVDYNLLGYGNWDNFTNHCCCISKTNLSAQFPYYVLDVEDWFCDNGRVKERVRRDAYLSVVVSGYAVRDLCGMSFKRGCKLETTKDGNVVLNGCVVDETYPALSEEEKKRW
ncbi:hypothetical protein LSM04_004936 [Trypanosoma melophagium]|uniref:uncharacterized protein n=1 Tax=Trypanosoma melophagium TaxID=715481 RepID=UPI00351A920E|nr:hypothetical protein LSM04_004936 [Trypanosoma melophagium]